MKEETNRTWVFVLLLLGAAIFGLLAAAASRTEMAGQREVVERLEAELQKVGRAEEELEALRGTISSLKSENVRMKQEEAFRIEEAVAELNKEVARLKTRETVHIEALEQAKAEAERLRGEITRLKTERARRETPSASPPREP